MDPDVLRIDATRPAPGQPDPLDPLFEPPHTFERLRARLERTLIDSYAIDIGAAFLLHLAESRVDHARHACLLLHDMLAHETELAAVWEGLTYVLDRLPLPWQGQGRRLLTAIHQLRLNELRGTADPTVAAALEAMTFALKTAIADYSRREAAAASVQSDSDQAPAGRPPAPTDRPHDASRPPAVPESLRRAGLIIPRRLPGGMLGFEGAGPAGNESPPGGERA